MIPKGSTGAEERPATLSKVQHWCQQAR